MYMYIDWTHTLACITLYTVSVTHIPHVYMYRTQTIQLHVVSIQITHVCMHLLYTQHTAQHTYLAVEGMGALSFLLLNPHPTVTVRVKLCISKTNYNQHCTTNNHKYI